MAACYQGHQFHCQNHIGNYTLHFYLKKAAAPLIGVSAFSYTIVILLLAGKGPSGWRLSVVNLLLVTLLFLENLDLGAPPLVVNAVEALLFHFESLNTSDSGSFQNVSQVPGFLRVWHSTPLAHGTLVLRVIIEKSDVPGMA